MAMIMFPLQDSGKCQRPQRQHSQLHQGQEFDRVSAMSFWVEIWKTGSLYELDY